MRDGVNVYKTFPFQCENLYSLKLTLIIGNACNTPVLMFTAVMGLECLAARISITPNAYAMHTSDAVLVWRKLLRSATEKTNG